jgi:hypothetical protein
MIDDEATRRNLAIDEGREGSLIDILDQRSRPWRAHAA